MESLILRCFRVLLLVLCSLSLPPNALAHQQWLLPNWFIDSGDGSWVTFDHTFSDSRFRPGSGPSSYYQWWAVGPENLKESIPFLYLGKTRAIGEIELTKPGTYRLEGVENRMAWTRIKVDGEERWQPGTRADHVGREILTSRSYFNKALAYVTLGESSSVPASTNGDPLEISFGVHPNRIAVGKTIRFRTLASGQALTGQDIEVYTELGGAHDDPVSRCTSDREGWCELIFERAGLHLLVTSARGEYPPGSETDGYSHGVNVMLRVER
ncbi:MAG: DUF4198 domain-containing protein [Pseudomonadota bacterium]